MKVVEPNWDAPDNARGLPRGESGWIEVAPSLPPEPAPSSEAAQALFKADALEKRVAKLERQLEQMRSLVTAIHDAQVKPKRQYGRRGLTGRAR